MSIFCESYYYYLTWYFSYFHRKLSINEFIKRRAIKFLNAFFLPCPGEFNWHHHFSRKDVSTQLFTVLITRKTILDALPFSFSPEKKVH